MPRTVTFMWAGVQHNVELPVGAKKLFGKKHSSEMDALWTLRLNARKGGEMFYATKDKFLVVYQYGERWFKYRIENGFVHAHGRKFKIHKR